MTQYCAICTGSDGQRIEMELIPSGPDVDDYQCPCCMNTRRVQNGIAKPVTAEEIRAEQERNKPKKSSFIGKAVKLAAGVAVAAVVIGAASSKK